MDDLSRGGAKVGNWTFLTNHGGVFLHLVKHPGDTIRLVSDHLGLAERTVAGIIADLREGGYLLAEKRGTQNVYTVNPDLSMRHPAVAEYNVSDLLSALSGRPRAIRSNRTGTRT
jgi:DNA-binding transcriptional ArsR family regulator